MTYERSAVTPDRLRTLFKPRSVAMIGASDKSIFSNLAYKNLVDFGFEDRLHLVNRRGSTAHGRATVTSCSAIDEPVDVAFMMLPQAATPDALSEAAAAGIRNAVVLSSGYSEAGEAGRQAQDELARHADDLGMLLLGPNHLGFVNFVDRIPVAAIPGLPQTSGPVALLSQSGGSCSQMITFASMCDIGLSYVVTLGNEAMVSVAHVLDYLVDDESTSAIAVFMETVRDPNVFHAAARRAAIAGKPIVAIKAGRSELAARTAEAHTGALVGDDRVIDAVFEELGVIRVGSIEDMLLTASAAARIGPVDRPGIGIVSVSGGACDMAADTALEVGASLPEFAPATVAALEQILPDYGTAQNPLDTPGGIIDPSIFTRTIETVSCDPEVGVVAIVQTVPWVSDGTPYVRQVLVNATGEGMARAAVPTVYINQILQPVTDYTREIMAEGRIPFVLPGLRNAILSLAEIGRWSEARRRITAARPVELEPVVLPPRLRRSGAWSEADARALLEASGVPVVPAQLCTSAEDAVAAAADLDDGAGVVLKIVSSRIVHKSDVGGVRLAVRGAEAVRVAHDDVVAAAGRVAGATVDGVLVSPMRTGGIELLAGMVRDPQWGPMLAVAIGGIFVEVLDDVRLTPLPTTPDRVREQLTRLRGAALFAGPRGGPAADLGAVADVVSRIGNLAFGLGPDLESLEVNPLRVDGAQIEALDAVVSWVGS